MGWWHVSADTLAQSRFRISPLAEVTASLMLLEHGAAAHPGERRWRAAPRPAYHERLAGDPVTALLVRAAFGARWVADFLAPAPPADGEPVFGDEVARVRAAPAQTAYHDLVMSLGAPLPAALRRPDLPQRAADLLEWVWTETVLPVWPQRRRILEADMVARTAKLSQGGWAAVLAGLRPGMRWLGEGRLQINVYDYPPRDICGAQLLFVPITPRRGWVSWDIPHRYAVVYPCAGVLAGAGQLPVPKALGALLGPGRARVLLLLDTPLSTTQLVGLTGQGLGSVGRHLKVLHEAGLVRRRRAGRSVLYDRTEAGDAVAGAQPGRGHPAGTPASWPGPPW